MKTDAQLKTDVMEELQWEPTVTASEIHVAVNEGVVTLTGTVPHYAEKWAAERATQRVEGVKSITDDVKVRLVSVHERTDAEITQAVASSLSWHVWVPDAVGTVTSWDEREEAGAAAWNAPGVIQVENDLAVACNR